MLGSSTIISLVSTIKERCKICYTCVKECPAKAIKIADGQAEVIDERCIRCGNCIKVCRQNAKTFQSSVQSVFNLLNHNGKVAACVAPSFPAEFKDFADYKQFVGILRSIGFTWVHEVAFGADLIAEKYKELFNESSSHYISSDCPAIVSYIEKYYPELVCYLAPHVSPMVATARVIRKKHGNDTKIVFIGPCIAKKDESSEVDAALTFKELRELFQLFEIKNRTIDVSEFDFPLGGKGAIFPLSRGLLQTVGIDDSIVEGNIIVSDGKSNFPEAIREFENDLSHTHHLELLCCEGCVMGAGMSIAGNALNKRKSIKNYVNNKLSNLDYARWNQEIEKYISLDLSQEFTGNDKRILSTSEEEIDAILKKMGKLKREDHLDCGTCGYDTCTEHAIAIANGLAEDEMCLPYTIDKLHNYIKELAVSKRKAFKYAESFDSVRKACTHGTIVGRNCS